MSDKEYSGSERRNPSPDHDTLVQLVQIISNHVKNSDNHMLKFEEHVREDKDNFDKLIAEQRAAKDFQMKIIGGLLVTSIIIQVYIGFHK